MEMTTDMLAPEDVLAPAAPAPDALLPALPTLSPEKYAAAVYKPFKSRLESAIDSVKSVNYDITTTAGHAVAVKLRALFRDVRVDANNERKARKEPIIKIGKLLESGFDEIEARVTPLEELFDADIQAEAARKLELKRANEQRIADIKVTIEAIRMQPARAVGKSSAELRTLLEQAAARTVTEAEFAEFVGDAQAALDTAGAELFAMFNAAEAREAAAAQAEADRQAELKAIADQKAEQARIAAAQAAKEKELADAEAELRRQRDKDAATARAAQLEVERLAKVEADKVAAANAAAAKAIADAAADLAAKQVAFQREQDDAAAAAALYAEMDKHYDAAIAEDAARTAARIAEKQAMVDEAVAAGHEQAADEQIAGMPAGALSFDAMADALDTDEAHRKAVLDCAMRAVADQFGLLDADALDELESLTADDYIAARIRKEAA